MSAVAKACEAYIALRRSMGFKYVGAARRLRRLAQFMEDSGESTLTTSLALSWTQKQSGRSEPGICYSIARGFARYLAGVDPLTQIPPPGLVPCRWNRRPYLYTDIEVSRLLAAARNLPAYHGPMLGLTMECLIGLLAATGLRLSEAIHLERADVDLDAGMLTIRGTKFGKNRLVPLHPSALKALRNYAASRDRCVLVPRHPQFFIGARGARFSKQYVEFNFGRVRREAGITGIRGSRPPRLHDLRHHFAMQSLKAGLRRQTSGDQVLATLATYLGHTCLRDTYWYLSASPELLALATRRLERLAQVRRCTPSPHACSSSSAHD